MADWLPFLIKTLFICIAGILMIFLGKYQQKKQIPLWVKLIIQGLIVYLVILVGIKIEFLRNNSGEYLYLANLSIPITLVWLISITNSVGQTDDLGDITPSIVFIASTTFLIVSIFQRQGLILAEILSLFLIICSLVIIYLKKKGIKRGKKNFESYNMFFGFVLAIIAIVGVLKSTAALTLLTPFLILGFPIIDASYSFISGFISNDYLGTMNESKLRQQLIDLGFSWNGANIIILSSCIYLSLIAIVISLWEDFYLFTFMVLFGYSAFYWLKQKVNKGIEFICFDNQKNRVELFGVPIDRINCMQAIEKIDTFVKNKKPCYIVTPDTLAILRARRDREYMDITKNADLVTADGAGILWAATTLNNPLCERITGIDLINQICQLATEKFYRLYLLGAKNDIIEKAVINIKKKYKDINIVGYHHGYLTEENQKNEVRNSHEKEVIRDIQNKKPDFLLVGMGVPKQEIWIEKYKNELNVPVCIGVGGSFDVLSGKIPRAPLWMQNHGMEWLFRLIMEPKRFKRIIALPYFMWIVFLGKIILFFREDS